MGKNQVQEEEEEEDKHLLKKMIGTEALCRFVVETCNGLIAD